MGREVRIVPPNWAHPEAGDGHSGLQPMNDEEYSVVRQEWIDGFLAHKPDEHEGEDYWEYYGPPPERAYYRPWKDSEATWFQLWETVSEGTPVSPPFATKEELAAYLAEHGDFWDQRRGKGGWGIERASAFVSAGWAPSFVVTADGRFLDSKDVPLEDLARS